MTSPTSQPTNPATPPATSDRPAADDGQYAAFAARVRRAVLAAVIDGTICHRGAHDVLTEWELPGLPMAWHIQVLVPVTHHVTDPDAAVHVIYERLTAALSDPISVHTVRDIRRIPTDTVAGPGYDVIATAVLYIRIIAADAATAENLARDLLRDAYTANANAIGMAWDLSAARWDTDHPTDADLVLDRDAPITAEATTAETRPDHVADSSEPHSQRLEQLKAAIRNRAIRAIRQDLAAFDEPWEMVDRFLADLGLPPLPHAWLVLVYTATTVTLAADSAEDALTRIRAAARHRGCRTHRRVDVDHTHTDTPTNAGGGLWQATRYEHLYISIRDNGSGSGQDPTGAATRLATAHLDALGLDQPHGHRLIIAATRYVIDPILDPDQD